MPRFRRLSNQPLPQHRPLLLLLLLHLHLPRLRGLAVGANALRRLVVCRTLRPVSGLRT